MPAGDPRILRSALLCPSIDDWMAMIEAMPDEGMYTLGGADTGPDAGVMIDGLLEHAEQWAAGR